MDFISIPQKVYSCYKTGEIIESDDCFPAGFSIVKKYPVVYAENLPRFKGVPQAYGHPFAEKPERLYLGPDREGMGAYVRNIRRKRTKEENERLAGLQTFDEEGSCVITNEGDALFLRGLSLDSDDYEIIHTKVAGSEDGCPDDYRFLGYDICYKVDCEGGFSIVGDCMFICRWHGCDEEGTLFLEDYEKLNENGLFDSWDDAYRYMVKYLSQDWSERGDYAIYEVRGKNTD